MNRNKWYERFNDSLFLAYYTSGEATAVHIVRDIVKRISTHGKWIDVVFMDIMDIDDSCSEYNLIIVELFPRLTQPNYKKYVEILPFDDTFTVKDKECINQRIREDNRYITWQTSHMDISAHKSKNHHGEKFIILCRLNRHKSRSAKQENDYMITAINRISQKQINYINEHYDILSEKIQLNGKPTLDILNVPVKKKKSKVTASCK